MCGACCSALTAIRGRRVGELDVLGDVIGREHDFAASVRTAQRQAPIRVGRTDDPAVTVLHPCPAGRDEPVVVTGHHLVADSRHLPVGYRQLRA